MRNFIIATAILSCTACDGTRSNLNAETERVTVVLKEGGTVTPPEQETRESSEEIVPKTASDEISPEAQAPVMIGGAFLSCTPKGGFTQCVAYNRTKEVIDFPAVKAFAIDSRLNWIETPFTRSSAGHYTVDVPRSVSGSFAIALNDIKSQMLADWIIAAAPPQNMVLNPSFESYIDLTAMSGYGYATSSGKEGWDTRLPEKDANCATAVLEIQLERDTMKPHDGKIAAELNTNCTFDGKADNNSILFQKVKVKKKNLYQIRFFANRAGNNAKAVEFNFAIDGKSVISREHNEQDWIEYKTQAVATQDTLEISFQELNVKGLGQGTLIDAVSIYDLGEPKK